MDNFLIPFNYEPVSTTTHATTYNLPAGKYARITPIDFESDLVIDGEIVMHKLYYTGATSKYTPSHIFTNVGLVTVGTSGMGARLYVSGYTANSSYPMSYEVRDGGGNPVLAGGTNAQSYTSLESDVAWNDNFTIWYKNASNGVSTYIAWSVVPSNVSGKHFWASGGSGGITITGDKFVVELYNSIT